MLRRRWALIAAGLMAAGVVAANGCQVVAGLYSARAAHCADGVRNNGEQDVDCGDSAGDCPACIGGSCKSNEDCQSLNCADGTCAINKKCNDPARECWMCHECPVPHDCASQADCVTGFCQAGICATCTSDPNNCPIGTCKDGNCIAVTCAFDGGTCPGTGGSGTGGSGTGGSGTGGTGGTGGATSSSSSSSSSSSGSDGGVGDPCTDSSNCGMGLVCVGNVCATPTCTDALQDGSETDVDCGGSCPPCADGRTCGQAVDCQSGSCISSKCTPEACVGPGSCAANRACVNGFCRLTGCSSATYSLGCGAPNNDPCNAGSECWSGMCDTMHCAPPSCSDGVQNGAETDVDCGAVCGTMGGCNTGQKCMTTADCLSGHLCTLGHCL